MNLKKLFVIVIGVFIVVCMSTLLFLSHEKVLRANVSIETITNLTNHKVYLLNKDYYYVEVDVFLDPIEEDYPIRSIFEYLKEDNSDIESSFYGYIPKDVSLIHYEIIDSILYLDLSNDFIDYYNDFLISGIVHSYLRISSVEKVSISVSSREIGIYDYHFPINVFNEFYNRENIQKVVEYYIYNHNYYVPITRYVNDSREKIHIILEDIMNNIPSHLISYYNNRSVLLSYTFENNMMILNFNSYFLDDKIEDNMKAISYSIFSNYDVDSVLFKVNGKIEKIHYSIKKP